MLVAPAPGHLTLGSKAVFCSNQSSQWATLLIQFYFISSEQTTRGVCTFLGSCCSGVILSVNDLRSDSYPITAQWSTWFCLRTKLQELCSRRNKDRHSSFSGHTGKSSRINDAIHQIMPDDQPPTKPGQHHRTCTHSKPFQKIKYCTLSLENWN